ncbi:MAG: arylsulfotransferase family protein, partial [Thermoleophilaceae bacterium]
NTALVLGFRTIGRNLKRYGGPKHGAVLDNVVQEIDIKTGLVEREWHSLGHVSVKETVFKPEKNAPFEALHANSVERDTNGAWLISGRDTNAAYEVDATTGNVLWTLGGKRSTFKMKRGARFIGQHDVRRAPNGNITVFDNGTFGIKVGRASRTLEVAVDTTAKTVSLVHGFVHRRPTLRTFSQGSTQTLPNGNLLVGWGGANAYITEFSKSGSVVFDALLHPTGDDTYRAYRLPWSGATPAETPRAAAAISHGATNVWASWNGATDVARWQVLGGSSSTSLAPVGSAAYSGFETALKISGARRFVQVQALDASGKVLGSSAVMRATG